MPLFKRFIVYICMCACKYIKVYVNACKDSNKCFHYYLDLFMDVSIYLYLYSVYMDIFVCMYLYIK